MFNEKVHFLLDTVYRCHNVDSIIRALEKRDYDECFILKDQYITFKLDSLICVNTIPKSKTELARVLGSNIKIRQLDVDSSCFLIEGGYILFSYCVYPKIGQSYVLFNSKMDMYPSNKREKRKNKMYVECDVRTPNGLHDEATEYFFNCIYAYKYLGASIICNTLLWGGENVLIKRDDSAKP